jgi:hypothetical protein
MRSVPRCGWPASTSRLPPPKRRGLRDFLAPRPRRSSRRFFSASF